jgi:YD repeat-containing protein
MVAVFTGNALGLFNTSLTQVGGGLAGGAGRDQQGVNAATGNLVLQGTDELMTYRGLTVSANRTYNSLGVAQAGADAWRTGFESTIAQQSGASLALTTADGSQIIFAYDAARGLNVSTAGDGAHDTLQLVGNQWIREDGNTLRREYYDRSPNGLTGRLAQVRETRHDGVEMARFNYIYDANGRVVEIQASRAGVADGSNEALVFSYDESGRIAAVYTRESGMIRQQVAYQYDTLGRLAVVEYDLTPLDSPGDSDTWDLTTPGANDGRLYRNTYEYEGNSLRIASVRGSDGQVTNYTYWFDSERPQHNGKIQSVTRGGNPASGDGPGETTTFTYAAGRTDVTDGLGRMWSYHYDASGQLTQLHGPARSGLRDVTTYTYDPAGKGDITQVRTERGSVLLSRKDYTYDTRGNVLWEWDALGNAIQRTWTAANQIETQTVFTGVDADGPGAGAAPSGGLVTRYVYDLNHRLRFTVGPSGEVSEMRYATSGNALGQVSETRSYLTTAYTGAYTLAALTSWAGGQASNSSQTTYDYDLAGRVSVRREFAGTTGAAPVASAAMSITDFVYDAQGLLRSQVTRHGASHTAGATAESEVVDYVYDGIGRLLDVTSRSSVPVTGQPGQNTAVLQDTRSQESHTTYLDSARQVRVVGDSGATRLETRSAAGRLVAVSEAGEGMASRNIHHYYDDAGQLRASQDAGGGRSYHFYDERGHRVASVGPTGELTEFEYDSLGRVVLTRTHADRIDTTQWMNGQGATASLALPTLAYARPGWLQDFQDGVGPMLDTSYLDNPAYPGMKREGERIVLQSTAHPTETLAYLNAATAVPTAQGPSYRAEISTGDTIDNVYAFFGLQNAGGGGQWREAGWIFRDGMLSSYVSGTARNPLLALSANTTYVVELYASSNGIEMRAHVKGQDAENGVRFSSVTDAAYWQQAQMTVQTMLGPGYTGSALSLDNLSHTRVRQSTADYDTAGRLVREYDGTVTRTHEYDAAHRLLRTTVSAPALADRVTRHFYDASGRVLGTLDAEGYLVEFGYDVGGRLVRTTRYAALTAEVQRANGTLASLRPTATANDQVTRYFHDRRDRQIGMLDAEGHLTEWIFDDGGNQRVVRAYAKKLAPGGTTTFQALLGQAMTSPPAEPYRETKRLFDALGRVQSEINHEGTVTAFHYDTDGRLVRTEVAVNAPSEVRNGTQLFDAFNQLIGELDGAGSVDASGNPRITADMTQEQKKAVIAQYGVSHAYDALGRRIETVDALGHRTWYFHDAAGRLTHTVRGRTDTAGTANALGEVTETRYGAFGEVSETLAYTGSIAITADRGVTLWEAARNAINTVLALNTAVDSRRLYFYDSRGLLVQQSDAENGLSVLRYNGFGELVSSTAASGTSAASTTTRTYDRRGLLTGQTDGVGTSAQRASSRVLDAFGREVSSIDGRGLATSMAYDRLGRLVSTSRAAYTGLSGLARTETTGTTYDAYSRVLTQTNALGQITRYAYSDTTRSVTVTTPDLLTMSTFSNRHGQGVQIFGPGGALTTYQYDKAGRQVRVTDALGDFTTSEYDVRGLLVATVAGNGTGNRVQYTYDAAGRVLTRTEDAGAGRLNLVSSWSYDAQGRQVTAIDALGRKSTTHHDREGRVLSVVRDDIPGGLQIKTQYTWDAAGRQLSVTEGHGTAAARTVDYAYDALGRRSSETVAPGTLNLTTSYAYDHADNVIARTDALGNVTRFVYDQSNRLVASLTPISGPGVVPASYAATRMTYDEAGRLTSTRRYANAISVSAANLAVLAAPSGAAALATMNTLTSAARSDSTDAVDFRVYDAGGRLRYTLVQNGAATAYISAIGYDPRGNASHETNYGVAVSLTAGNQTAFQMQGDVTAATAAARLTAAGALIGVQGNSVRELYRVFDLTGQERFVVTRDQDGMGAVVEKQFDDEGNVIRVTKHAHRIEFDPTDTVDEVVAGVAVNMEGSPPHQTTYVHDRLGRLTSVTDALQRTESYGYDAVGNRISYTNKLQKTWNYAYDAAGRMVEEKSPPVWVNAYADQATFLLTGSEVRITTRTVYDATGNVIERIENADAPPAQQRKTTYAYDSRGLQVRTTFPDAWRVDEATGGLVASGLLPTVDVTYDALGRAVMQKDVLGNHSYKVYDQRGLVTHEVDAGGYVTAYQYDVLGRATVLTRHATPLNAQAVAGWTAGTPIPAATIGAGIAVHADDRKITTSYDQLGRKITVQQLAITHWTAAGTSSSVAPRTDFVYDGLGQLVKETVLIKTGTSASTHHYYDRMGQRTLSVDPLGHVTAWAYDAYGQETLRVEFARPIATAGLTTTTPPALPAPGDLSTGYDRSVISTYDDMGRKISETTPRLAQSADGTSRVQASSTQYTYDAEDRVLAVTVDGVTTRTQFDALGRTTAVTESARQVLRQDWQALLTNSANTLSSSALYETVSPHVTMGYDAFGNAVVATRYARGVVGTAAPVADANDQVSYTLFDRQGRAVASRDALGNASFNAYDAADRIVQTWSNQTDGQGRTWKVVANHGWDALGRQVSSTTKRTSSGMPDGQDASQAMRYSAFGEVVRKADTLGDLNDDAGGRFISYTYDKAGNLLTSNAEGSVVAYGYNLAGQQVRELRWKDSDTTAATVVTWMTLDLLGRTTATTLPTHTAVAGDAATVRTRLDRWGNVLEQTDPRGHVTSWVYNDRNQAIRQLAPTVLVVSEDGTQAMARPETRWMYDAAGRLIAVRDANGNLDRTVFDASGRVLQEIDAMGNATRHAYDALGQARVQQDATGYLTTRSFDRLGRVTAIGDYLTTLNGLSRTQNTRESYLLDQGGNRVSVTNAVNNVQRMDYDSRGLLLRSLSGTGVEMQYRYDAQGNKIEERYAGLWQDQTWAYSAAGKLVDHSDLGNNDYNYVYGKDGRLKTETNGLGMNRNITYYANGQVKRIDLSPAGLPNTDYSEYEYDASGNRTLERTVNTSRTVNLVTRVVYDGHNRIARVTTDDLTRAAGQQRTLTLEYTYDAVGNRRNVVAYSGYGPNVTALPTTNQSPLNRANPEDVTLKQGQAREWRWRPNAYFVDPDGDAMTYSVQGTLPSWLTYAFDATTKEWVFTTNGTGVAGNTVVVTMVASGAGGTAAALFNVSVVLNSAPVPRETAALVIERKNSQAINLEFVAADLFKDSDVGELLALDLAGAVPSGFAAVVGSAGRLSLTASAGIAPGDYSVIVRATDASGATATRSVIVRVTAPAAPTALATASLAIQRYNEFSHELDIQTLFADANGDSFMVTGAELANGSPLPAWIAFSVHSEGDRRFVRLTGTAPSDAALNSVVSVRLRAMDSDGMVGTKDVALVVGWPPTVPTVGTLTISVAKPISQALTGYADPSGGTLTYAASGLPAGLSLTSTGVLTGSAAELGSHLVRITVTNAGGVQSWKDVTLIVRNIAPTITALSNQAAVVNAAWSLNVSTAMADPDGHAITATASGMPPGVTFDGNTKVFSGTPTTAGPYTITVTVQDGYGGIATGSFSLTVDNDPTPRVLNPIPAQDSNGGVFFSYTFPANTFSGTPANYTLTTKPGWMTIDSNTRTISGTPLSTYSGSQTNVTLRATYAGGGFVETTFVMIVYGNEGMGGGGRINVEPGAGETEQVATGSDQLYAAMVASDDVASFTDASLAATAPAPMVQSMSVQVPGQNRQEAWYTYDAENRVSIVNGKLENGQILLNRPSVYMSSYLVQYDAMGRESAQIYSIEAGQTVHQIHYSQRGERLRTSSTSDAAALSPTVVNTYDAAGRLSRTTSYFHRDMNLSVWDPEGFMSTENVGGLLQQVVNYTYDADGRLVSQTTWGRKANSMPTPPNASNPEIYSAPEWLRMIAPNGFLEDRVAQSTDPSVLKLLEEVLYTTEAGVAYSPPATPATTAAVLAAARADDQSAYDGAGRLLSYRYVKHATEWSFSAGYSEQNQQAFTHSYGFTFEARDGYLEKSIVGTSSNSRFKTTTSTSTYDAAGRRTAILETTPIPDQASLESKREMAYNAEGQILTRRDFYKDGSVWKQGKDEGSVKLQNIAPRLIDQAAWTALTKAQRESWYDARDTQRMTYANGQLVTSQDEAGKIDATGQLTGFSNTSMGRTQVQVQQGDTLKSLAQRVYGNENLWYVLADANGLQGDDALVAGSSLTVPEVKTSSNDASTFKPYNPSEITGPTTPSLPYIPPPDQGCGAIGMLIMLVVTIAVTVYTAGAAATALSGASSVLGTAGAGVAGGFGAVGTAALTGGGIIGGSGIVLGAGAAIAGAAIGATVGSIAGQAVGSALGVASFSWRNAIASGASAAVTAGVGAAMGGGIKTLTDMNQWGKVAASATLNAAGGYAAQKLAGVDGGFSWKSIAASAVSSVITAKVSDLIGSRFDLDLTTEPGQRASDLINTSVGSIVSTHTRRQFGFDDDIHYGRMLLDTFGTVLGNSLAGVHAQRAEVMAARVQPYYDQLIADEVAAGATTPAVDYSGLAYVNGFNGSSGGVYGGPWTQSYSGYLAAAEPEHSSEQWDAQVRATGNWSGTYAMRSDGVGLALTIEVTGDHRRDLWRQAQAMWAMDNGRPLPAQNASWSQLGYYYEREYAATAPAHHKYLTEGYAATRGNVGPRGKTFMTPEQFSFYKRQDDLLLLKVATAPMVSATLGALAVASPVIGGGLSVYGMYNGANTLANADSAADYALGTIELVGSALGLSYATRQLSSARGALEMAWMPLGTRGQATALTNQTKGWQDFGVVPDYSKLKFYPVGPAANSAPARAAELEPGVFSISDWTGYPQGVSRPQGPFRMVEGAEYDAARTAANNANRVIRRAQGLVGQRVDVHEIQPVKFGGSPTDSANKVVLPRDLHRQQVTPWWNQLQTDLGY